VKVVAIQGSPHEGNTSDRVERFGRTLESLGEVDFEHVRLKDVDIKPCRGCFVCFTQGEDSCPIKDDRAAIELRLAEADAVVFASPVYSMHISYLFKRFVDRLAYTFHRPRYFGRYAVGLAVTGGVGLKEALEYIRMLAGAWGFEYVGDLRYVDPPRNTNMPRLVREADRTEEVARRLHRLMRSRPEQRLTQNDHLMFHAMRAVYARMEAYSPADYAYWKERGWLDPDARYFTDRARVGLLKSIYPRLVAWLMGRGMDREIARLRDSEDESREADRRRP
jgi:multimeric flavodoxin WrbA